MKAGCWFDSGVRPDKPAREYTRRERTAAITDLTAAGIHGGRWPDWPHDIAARECWVLTVEAFEQALYREWPGAERECPKCNGPMVELGDGLTCVECGHYGIPCWGCDGWITDYVGIIKGDHVSECPDCGQRHYTAADWWEVPEGRQRWQ